MDYTPHHHPPPIGAYTYSSTATTPEPYIDPNDLLTPPLTPTPPPPPRPRRPRRPKYIYKIHYHVSCSKTGARYHIIRRGRSYLATLQKAKVEVEKLHASWFEYWWNDSLKWAAMDQFKRRSRRWWARNARRHQFADRKSSLDWREWERICLGKHGGMGQEWYKAEARRGKYGERGVNAAWGFPLAPEAALPDVRGDRLRRRGVRRVWRVRRVGWGNSKVRVVRIVRKV